MFQGFLNFPNSDELKAAHARQLLLEKEMFKFNSLRKMGYTDEEITLIREQMRNSVESDSYLVGG